MSEERRYTSRRQAIVDALAEAAKQINGTGSYKTKIYNVESRLVFWDEVESFPAINFAAGTETRAYQGGGYKDRFLNVTARCYVNEENSQNALGILLEDLETLVEKKSRLAYTDSNGNTNYTQQISVINITTDEGVLDPIGIGEMSLEVRY